MSLWTLLQSLLARVGFVRRVTRDQPDRADRLTKQEPTAETLEALVLVARRQRAAQKRAALRAVGGRSGPARNQPCPCGSGRKYKRCCGRSVP